MKKTVDTLVMERSETIEGDCSVIFARRVDYSFSECR